ncbi:MAG: zeta toxin family protein [Methanosarcina sp.]|jgi:CO dehydrogenase maturation factor|nr:zeta toxin family protein [Methanosarcina sp.]MDD3874263.1 zeta toxin family protein [Methanosarcina sp.]MDD4521520.1 zeta toxin family protein [Methanosarcina sp.]HHV24521.1 ATP-binding protein [Methanosarcina sp.]
MRIAVCGKGGSGKSTISALLAKEMAKTKNVLVLDIDESNYGLHSQLGMAAPRDLMEYFGGKKGFREKQRAPKTTSPGGLTLMGSSIQQQSRFFKKKWGFSDLPPEFVEEKENLRLMAVGKIHDFGEGCACPMGVLTREFLENLDLGKDDVVIVDTEAGTEHFGRGVDKVFDLILVVVDPSYESLKLSKKFGEFGVQCGCKVYFVLNRVEPDIREEMLDAVNGLKVVAEIPAKREIFKASLKGEELDFELDEIKKLAEFLRELNY